MRISLLLSVIFASILAVSSVSALGGWYYAGDTFTDSGVVYSVEGFSTHERVLLGVNGQSFLLTLGECLKNGAQEYCYTESAYPDDTKHIKYAAGKQYFGAYLTILTVKPTILVSRKVSSTTPKLGDTITVDVVIQNTGDYAVQSFSYVESIPDGMQLIRGPGFEAGSVQYTAKALSLGDLEKFSYTLQVTDYVNGVIVPNISYSFEGRQFNVTIPTVSFLIETPFVVTKYLTPSLNIGDTGKYLLNITNKDDTTPMTVNVSLRIPAGLSSTTLVGFKKTANGMIIANATLPAKSTVSFSFEFVGTQSGSFIIPVDVVAKAQTSTFRRHYEERVTSKSDKISGSIKFSNNRPSLVSGEQLKVTGILENVNPITSFSDITGTISCQDLFAPVNFNHDSFPPKKTLTEVEATVVIPEVNETKAFTVRFDGHYTGPGGMVFDFNATKTLLVAPAKTFMTLKRTVVPERPTPGSNVTITLFGTNIYGEYITYNSHDANDQLFPRVGGMVFGEDSLEKGASKQLYTYSIEIPQNFTGTNFTITTTLYIKGEPAPTTNSLVVWMTGQGPAPAAQVNTTVPTPPKPVINTTGDSGTDKKEMGFFESIWDFIKNLF